MSIPHFFFHARGAFRGLAPAAQSSLREHEQLALRATRSILPPHQNKKTRNQPCTFRGLAPAAQNSLREHEQPALRATRSVLPPHQNKKTRNRAPSGGLRLRRKALRARTARAPRDPLGPAATPKQKDRGAPSGGLRLRRKARCASTNSSRSARPARSCRHTKTKRHGTNRAPSGGLRLRRKTRCASTNSPRSARPARSCRHTKTKRHGKSVSFCFGAPSGTRTRDPLIKSQLLYQLS